MFIKRDVDSSDQLCHSFYAALNARLSGDIIVLDPVKKTSKTPKCVSLDGFENRLGKNGRVSIFSIGL